MKQDSTGSIGSRPAPGPKGLPGIGVWLDIRRDPLGFFHRMTREYGDVVALPVGRRTDYLVNHPDYVGQVLTSYPKGKFTERLEPLFGKGLVTNSGESWFTQRRLINPLFHRERLAGFAGAMVDATKDMIEDWRRAMDAGETIDIAHEMHKLTQTIIIQTMFSIGVGEELERIGRAATVVNAYLNQRRWAFSTLAESLPNPKHRKFQKALATLNEIVYRIIAERRAGGRRYDDLLAMLIEARDEDTGEGMPDKQIRDEMITMFFAGHVTAGTALTWTWYFLALHSDVRERLEAELEGVLGGRDPEVSDLQQLAYTKQVIWEAMRMYPPVWMMPRVVPEDVDFGGCRLPAGSIAITSAYALHHHPGLWDEPERYDPERFTPEAQQGRHAFLYLPFGGGPRFCIGNNFAFMEAQLVVAAAAQRFRMRVAPGYELALKPMLTIQPRDGIPMVLSGRGAQEEKRL